MTNQQEPRQEPATMQEIEETAPVRVPDASSQPENSDQTRRTIGLVLIAIVVLAIVGATLFGLATHPLLTAVLADIAIITLALVTVIIGLFLIILIFQLQSLIALLRDEIKPILDSTNETVSTVRGTTTFVSDAVVTPMIQVASFTAGVLQTLRTLSSTGHKKNRPKRSKPGGGQG
jgi:hypothetical protein